VTAPEQLPLFPEPEPERQIEPVPSAAEPKANRKERRRLRLIPLGSPERPRNRVPRPRGD